MEPCSRADDRLQFTLPVGAASSSERPCGHRVCRGCLVEYITGELDTKRRHVIACVHTHPAPACAGQLADAVVEAVLKTAPATLDKWRRLQVEALLGPNVVYCPSKACSHAFAALEAHEEGYPVAQCPLCRTTMCCACKSAWHEGLSCAQYQRLPVHMRSPEDAALVRMAGEQGWRPCPACSHVIEKNADGCSFVKCRCGAAFCFACGKAYHSQLVTDGNLHGRPACNCGLFPANNVQRDAAMDAVLAAAAAQQPGDVAARAAGAARVAARQSKRRRVHQPLVTGLLRGKWVTKPRLDLECSTGGTLAACPNGRKCWFRHTDE